MGSDDEHFEACAALLPRALRDYAGRMGRVSFGRCFFAVVCALPFVAGAQACSERAVLTGVPPSFSGGAGGAGGDGFNVGDASAPPDLDAGGLCGNQLHSIITDAPNLYFVLDASGSMGETVPAGGSRFEAVRGAALDLVRDLGALIQVGAAVFPHGATDVSPCSPGKEVMAVSPGDPFTGSDGPATQKFKTSTNVVPQGGTPTAATLWALSDTLFQLQGKTIVLLATDGGPNCNELAQCTASECIANIEQAPGCTGNFNCCEPGGPAGPGMCIDQAETVDALNALRLKGMKTYVIGIPGSETYADVLNEMALAGGAALIGGNKYFRIDDLNDLGDVLGSIASVYVSCDFTLEGAPPDPGLTNVYLDGVVLPYGDINGWVWAQSMPGTAVRLMGTACERLKHGQVKAVQIVSGCPTEVAK